MANDPKKPRQTRKPKPVYAVMSATDSDGNLIKLERENVTIHSVHKDADALLEMMEKGTLPAGSFYKRIALV